MDETWLINKTLMDTPKAIERRYRSEFSERDNKIRHRPIQWTRRRQIQEKWLRAGAVIEAMRGKTKW